MKSECPVCEGIVLTAAVTLFVVASTMVAIGESSSSSDAVAETRANVVSMSGFLRPILNASGKTGRVYYRATCPGPDAVLVFPRTVVSSPFNGAKGLTAVQQLFRDEHDVSVTEDDTGIVRIKIGQVPTSILGTRIQRLAFEPHAQYTGRLAIQTILSTQEVGSAMEQKRMRLPSVPSSMLLNAPDEHLPHLPAVLANVTVDQALDEVAKTFQHVVAYGVCPELGIYEITIWE